MHPAGLPGRSILLYYGIKEILDRKMRLRKSAMAGSLGDRDRRYHPQTENTVQQGLIFLRLFSPRFCPFAICGSHNGFLEIYRSRFLLR